MAQSAYWVGTLNNPEDHEFEPHRLPFCSYAIWQLEKGENGTSHYQFYVELSSRQRLSYWKKNLKRAHVEVRRGKQAEAIAYCSKLETRLDGPWIHGEPQKTTAETDLVLRILEGGDMAELAQEYPSMFLKYAANLRAISEMGHCKREPETSFCPLPWQQHIIDIVQKPADDRHVIWVYDPVGGRGKSRLARHLVLNYGATILSGRYADMAYMYRQEPIVCFDIARAEEEFIQPIYKCAETLKNGVIVSNKYRSELKIFQSPHVILFANVQPDHTKISPDRIIFIDLKYWCLTPANVQRDPLEFAPIRKSAHNCHSPDQEEDLCFELQPQNLQRTFDSLPHCQDDNCNST